MTGELDAFRTVKFDWTRQLQGVWRDPPYHVAALHQEVASDLMDYLRRGTIDPHPDPEPLGRILVGSAGSGKTHLMGDLRRRVWAAEGYFILLDFAGVRDFWSTIALGFLASLMQPMKNGRPQYKSVLYNAILKRHALNWAKPDLFDKWLDRPGAVKLATVDAFLALLRQSDLAATFQHGDVVRALLLLGAAGSDIEALAASWLQGFDIDPRRRTELGFTGPPPERIGIVRALSWLISLAGPSLIGIDQIDAIVSESNLAAAAQGAQGAKDGQEGERIETLAIIEALAGGLMEMHDVKRRAVMVVACLEATWQILRDRATIAVTDRFMAPILLGEISKSSLGCKLVAARVRQAYASRRFEPPYETWPFDPAAFETAIGFSPRQLLKACEEHRQRSLADGFVSECLTFEDTEAEPPVPAAAARASAPAMPVLVPIAGAEPGQAPRDLPTRDLPTRDLSSRDLPSRETTPRDLPSRRETFEASPLDLDYERQMQAARPAPLLNPQNDDRLLGELLVDVLALFADHLDLPEAVGVAVQADPDRARPVLHGRLAFTFHAEGEREQHYCFRALAQNNAIAFQGRLRAAMTAAGVDRGLKDRSLFVVRREGPPGGERSRSGQLARDFEGLGGRFIAPGDADLRAFLALREMRRRKLDGLGVWLKAKKPLFATAFFQEVGLAPPLFLAARPLAKAGRG